MFLPLVLLASVTKSRSQVALSRPSLSRYRSSSLKSAPDSSTVTEHASTGACVGSSVQHRQVHTTESHHSRNKQRMECRHSISPHADSNPRGYRAPGSPASPRSTREQLAAALEKAVKACAAENPHAESSASVKVWALSSHSVDLLASSMVHNSQCKMMNPSNSFCTEGPQSILKVSSCFSGRVSGMAPRKCRTSCAAAV